MLRFIAGKRLALGRLTVIDATNVQPEARKPLVELARQYHCLPVAVVLDLPERVCQERNRGRPDRDFGPHVVRNQTSQLRRSLRGLAQGGLPPRLRAGDARGGRGGDRRAGAALERPDGTSTARSTSSATSTAAATNWKRCSSGSATRSAVPPGDRSARGGRPTPTPRAARRSSSAIWWTAAPASSTRCGWCANMVAARLGPLRARQPRHEAAAEAPGQGRPDHARAGRDAGRDRRLARRSAGRRSARNWPSSSTAWSATTSSTAASWWSPTPG